MSANRPSPWQWLRYAYGAGLPLDQRSWVLHDTTSRTWAWRHLSRVLVQIAPVIVAIALLVPGPAWIRVAMVLGGTAMALVFSFAYVVETTEHRLLKAGYPVGTGEATRERRATEARRAATAKRRERSAVRAARRGR